MASEGFRICFRRFFAIMSSFHMKPLRAEVAVLRSETYFRIFYYHLLPSHRPNCHWCVSTVCDRTRHTRRCMDTKIVLDMPRCQRWAPSCRAPNTGTLMDLVRQSSVDVEDWSNGRLTPLESCGYCGLLDRLDFSCRWKFCKVLSVVGDKVVKDRSLPVIGEDIGLSIWLANLSTVSAVRSCGNQFLGRQDLVLEWTNPVRVT